MERTWRLVYRAKHKGHRYFEEIVDGITSGRIGVADESGDGPRGRIGTPDQTEDGILYLDTSEPILIEKDGARVPLLRPNGEESRTGEFPDSGIEVAIRFTMRVKVGDRVFWPGQAP